ncbi:MAG: hypothetical protein JSV09_03425 [Thermoplasmata archaeon]|nr:MAG: hypothetical protein JSV09_03425 [Thermoplasmata archaeon]
MVKRIDCLGIALVLICVCLSLLVIQQPVKATGDLDNQPPNGYSEGSETFWISSNTSTTTSFNPGETIYVGISTGSVNLDRNGELENELFLTDIHGVPVSSDERFTQSTFLSPYEYGGFISAPSSPDHYLLNIRIVDDNLNEFVAKDVIIVINDAVPQVQKHIKTYSDPAYSTIDWTFTSYDTIYMEVFSENNPNPGQSTVKFADYKGGESVIKIGDLSHSTVTMVGDYARFQYNISLDLDVSDLTNNVLDVGYWYTLSVDLVSTGGETLAKNWSIQIQIIDVHSEEPSLSVSNGATQANPNAVEREGSQITTISAEFQDSDEPIADSFTVTFKVRDPNYQEITIVDAK